MNKRVAAFFLAALTSLGLAGCGSTGGTGAQGTAGKAEEVSLYCVSFNNIPAETETARVEAAMNDYLAKTYPEDNVAIDIKLFGPAEYAQKVTLAMQSGDKVDCFLINDLVDDHASDKLYPLDELIQNYGQDLTEILKKDLDEDPYKAVTIDGQIWGVPVNKGVVLHDTLLYDKEIAEAAGVDIDAITCLEDLEAAFEKVNAYDDSIVCYAPLNQGDSSVMMMLRDEMKMDVLNDRLYYAGVTVNNEPEVINIFETEEFKEKCELMYRWNQAGYLQDDAATTTSTAPELFRAGRAFCTIGGYGGDSAGAIITASTGRTIESKILYDFLVSSASISVDFGIASTSKVPEAAMKLLNRLWTDEYLLNAFLYGIEGEDYVKVDEDHWAYPDGKDASTVGYTAALCTGVIGSESLQYQTVGTDVSDLELKVQHNKETERSAFYGFQFNGTKVKNEMSAIANVYKQYVPGLICGTVNPNEAIPEFLEALKAAGIDTVIQAKQEQLDAWLAQQ